MSPINNEQGLIQNINTVFVSKISVSGSGALVSFTFQVIDYGSTEISLNSVELYAMSSGISAGNLIPVTVADAHFDSVPAAIMPASVTSSSGVVCVVLSGSTDVSSVSLGPDPDPVGSTVKVDLYMRDAVGVWGWCAYVSWNAAVLELTGVQNKHWIGDSTGDGDLFTGSQSALWDNVHGLVRGGISDVNSDSLTNVASGSGVLATLTFRVVGVGVSEVSLASNTTLSLNSADSTGTYATVNSATLSFVSSSGSLYGFTFSETGLPSGTSWTVTCNGVQQSANAPNGISFSGLSGSVSYSVGSVSGYVANPSSGSVSAAGSQTVSFVSSSGSLYGFTFSETGLPSGTSWTVTCNGQTLSSSSTTIVFAGLATGTYAFIVNSVSGYIANPISGTITVSSSAQNTLTVAFSSAVVYTLIDVSTNKGGLGLNTPSDAFGPQELVKMYANVTYRGSAVPNVDVAFTIRNQDGSMISLTVRRTNATGIAYAEYRFPWPDGSNPEVTFGLWSMMASVNVSQVTVSDQTNFVFNYIIKTNDVTLQSHVERGSNLSISVNINNIENASITSTAVFTVYDEAKVPIGTFTTTCTNTPLTSVIVNASILIPSWAFVGQATVYIDILTKTLATGGVPYCPEKIVNFTILA
jgi:hypothetical protein